MANLGCKKKHIINKVKLLLLPTMSTSLIPFFGFIKNVHGRPKFECTTVSHLFLFKYKTLGLHIKGSTTEWTTVRATTTTIRTASTTV